LFERTAKSVKLTKAGQAFLDEARAVLQRADEAVKKARSIAAEPSELYIGYSPTPVAEILPKALRAFQQAMPNVHVRLQDWANQAILDGVRDGRLQLGLIVSPPKASSLPDLHYEELFHDRVCVAVAPQHPFARRRAIPLTDLAAEPLIGLTHEDYPEYYDYLSITFSKVKQKPRVVEEHDSMAGILSSVEAGTGVAIGADAFGYSYGNRVKRLRVIPEPKPISIGIIGPKGRLSPAAEKFWECAKEAAAKKSLSALRNSH
jgi:LysR family transcriptional regulator, benzoate and cis,cis-muconate-responsive activator of ben and cat genes